MSSKTR